MVHFLLPPKKPPSTPFLTSAFTLSLVIAALLFYKARISSRVRFIMENITGSRSSFLELKDVKIGINLHNRYTFQELNKEYLGMFEILSYFFSLFLLLECSIWLGVLEIFIFQLQSLVLSCKSFSQLSKLIKFSLKLGNLILQIFLILESHIFCNLYLETFITILMINAWSI